MRYRSSRRVVDDTAEQVFETLDWRWFTASMDEYEARLRVVKSKVEQLRRTVLGDPLDLRP